MSDNIIRIKYKNGDHRGNTCNGTERTSVILIVCNPYLVNDTLKFIEENFGRGFDCNYVFELQTNKICLEKIKEDPNKNGSKEKEQQINSNLITNNKIDTKNDSGASVFTIIFIT